MVPGIERLSPFQVLDALESAASLEVEQAQLVKCGRLFRVLLKDLQKLLFSGGKILSA